MKRKGESGKGTAAKKFSKKSKSNKSYGKSSDSGKIRDSSESSKSSYTCPKPDPQLRADRIDTKTTTNFGTHTPNMISIDDVFDVKLGDKLALIEEMRSSLGEEGIQCPGVVVVGAQSAGKSSVLERLTGLAFPRAENTCTRVPIIVQLQRGSSKVDVAISTEADFPTQKTNHAVDPTKIGDILLSKQHELTSGASIKDTPIHIRYTRQHGPVMTLIDLPGITHVNTADSTTDIHAVTKNMVQKYVREENMIVLVVIPAVDDFGNQEAIQIVKEEDAEDRCIGVVTKCDLVPDDPDKTDVLAKLKMERESDIILGDGFIAVRNRAPNEMDWSQEEAAHAEGELFQLHPVLSSLKRDEWGYETLIDKIVAHQSRVVHEWMPKVKSTIRSKLKEHKNSLKALGEAPKTPADRRIVLTELASAVEKRLDALICTRDTNTPEINVASRTREFALSARKSIDSILPKWLSVHYGEQIAPLVKETLGYTMSNFLSDPIFRGELLSWLWKNDNVESAVRTLNEEIHSLMIRTFGILVDEVSTSTIHAPQLREFVVEKWEHMLEGAMTILGDHNRLTFESEKNQTFTINHYYETTLQKVRATANEYNDINPSKNLLKTKEVLDQWSTFQTQVGAIEQELELENGFIGRYADSANNEDAQSLSLIELQLSLHCYVKVLLKRICDSAAMVARHLLMVAPHAKIPTMVASVSDEDLKRVMAEDQAMANKRAKIERSIQRLQSSLEKLARMV